MNRKYTYPFLMMLAIAMIFLAEKYLDDKAHIRVVEAGAQVKAENLSFFLPKTSGGAVIHHEYYSLEYNEEAEQASWVAYTLTKDHLVKTSLSRPYFDLDPAVPTGAAHWRNYKNSGYDRGHLCPAGDRNFSTQAYNETFKTSNISPQLHEFNSGVWNRLEHQVRDWAETYQSLTVVTAGVLNNPIDHIGEENVYVPAAFYKIVMRETASGYSCLAFLIPHSESTADLVSFVTTVDVLEEITGIDFFPQVEDRLENEIEASKNLDFWMF